MDSETARQVRGRLLNAGQPYPGKVSLPYEEIIRVVLLVGYYEKTWQEHQINDALHWWRALPEALSQSEGWTFTLRGQEPAWINEEQNGEFTTVLVSTDPNGRMAYQVISSHDGNDTVTLCPDVATLKALLSAS
ncbi:hypothetical protein ACF1GT_25710 [Streptomyces sp. NPDC014636]|uniref:hypothetical protein n=1 Tax=Streptomyces sp. NPDC014636 TaxID=3364876 RepID=UPI0036FA2141